MRYVRCVTPGRGNCLCKQAHYTLKRRLCPREKGARQPRVLDAQLDSIFGRDIDCSSADILSPTCSATFGSP